MSLGQFAPEGEQVEEHRNAVGDAEGSNGGSDDGVEGYRAAEVDEPKAMSGMISKCLGTFGRANKVSKRCIVRDAVSEK